MGKKDEDDMLMVPMEVGLQDDGSIRVVIHIEKPELLGAILEDIGKYSGVIIEALSDQMERFIKEKESRNG